MPFPVDIRSHFPIEEGDMRRLLRSCVACSVSVFEEKIGVVDGFSRLQLEDAIALLGVFKGLKRGFENGRWVTRGVEIRSRILEVGALS